VRDVLCSCGLASIESARMGGVEHGRFDGSDPGSRSVLYDHINSYDYSYVLRYYLSNYVRFVNYYIYICPDLPYIYEGVRPIENLKHIPIESIIFFMIHVLRVDIV
jgi:hypothetical protein